MKLPFLRHPLLLGVFSGIALSVAYRIPGAWPFSFVVLIPLIHAIATAKRGRDVFFAGTLAGTIVMAVAMQWVFSSLPFPAYFGTFPPVRAFLFVALGWVLASLATGAMLGAWAYAVRAFDFSRALYMGSAVALYAAAEYARMFFYNVLTFSPGTANPLFFSAGYIGYPLMDAESWRQAAVFGMWGASACAVVGNFAFYYAWRFTPRHRRVQAITVVVLMLVVMTITPVTRLRSFFDAHRPVDSATVGIVSVPAFDAPSAQASAVADVMKNTIPQNPALIVLPEGAQVFPPFSHHQLKDFGSFSGTVVDSGQFVNAQFKETDRAYAVTAAGSVFVRDKRILTPIGEYMPSVARIMLESSGGAMTEDHYDVIRTLAQGGDGLAVVAGPIRAPVLFCLEVMKPGYGAALARSLNANMIIVASSHAWFRNSPALETDILRFDRMQAVEAGIPLAQSTIGGPAYILDRYGSIVAEAGKTGESAFAIGTVFVSR